MSTPSPAIPRIFVSHSHADNDYCRAFVNGLRTHSLDVWYDEHNLGWGALRQVIEREMQAREHFIAILSPAAVVSEWVNAEIDAALYLLGRGELKTLLFVTADRCNVPLLLQRYKRIERADGSGYPATDAITRVLPVVTTSPATPLAAPASSAPTPPPARPSAPRSPVPSIPPDRFPPRLSDLGFTAHSKDGVAYILPPLCPVPAGPFLMGSDSRRDLQANDNEQPQHSVTLPAYQIARFPVTVAEYACFVRSGQKEPASPFNKLTWKTQSERLDHPVVNVGWHDAVAYAAWLAKLTGQPWRLPSEAEWEKAARGSDGRIYPWGNTFDASRANTRESGKGATTPVGAYPSSASPTGAQDMAGNVWEWVSTIFKPRRYSQSDGREAANSAENLVLRGGSWGFGARLARAAGRLHGRPVIVISSSGFRLSVAAPGQAGS